MNLAFRRCELGEWIVRVWNHQLMFHPLIGKGRRQIVHGDGPESRPLDQPQIAELRFADPRRVLKHGLEDGLKLAGRTRNDLQHLRGRDLLFQRLIALPLQQRDLLIQAGNRRFTRVGDLQRIAALWLSRDALSFFHCSPARRLMAAP